jgi:hypothetical protein
MKKVTCIIALCCILFPVFAQRTTQASTFELNVKVDPSNASVEINGGVVKSFPVALNPGRYSLTISAKGFQSQTVSVNLDSNQMVQIKLVPEEPVKPSNRVPQYYEVKVELLNFQSNVKDPGGNAEFYGDLHARYIEDGVEKNAGTLWSYTSNRTYDVGERSNNPRNDVRTYRVAALNGRKALIQARGIHEEDTGPDDKFNDAQFILDMERLEAGPQNFSLRSDYSKGRGEFVQFSGRISASPVF